VLSGARGKKNNSSNNNNSNKTNKKQHARKGKCRKRVRVCPEVTILTECLLRACTYTQTHKNTCACFGSSPSLPSRSMRDCVCLPCRSVCTTATSLQSFCPSPISCTSPLPLALHRRSDKDNKGKTALFKRGCPHTHTHTRTRTSFFSSCVSFYTHIYIYILPHLTRQRKKKERKHQSCWQRRKAHS
jgi:hypothetical protein